MKVKKFVLPAFIFLMVSALWLSGIIPVQIAKISGSQYVQQHFAEMELECVGVEYSHAHGNYLIAFEDPEGIQYSCVIVPRLFPVSMTQGLFAIEDTYAALYK